MSDIQKMTELVLRFRDAVFPCKLEKSAKKYPIEKSNGVGKKYTEL